MKKDIERSKDLAGRIDGGNLSEEERHELSAFIKKKKAARTPKQVLRDELIAFKVKLVHHLDSAEETVLVGDLLNEYIKITGIKKTEIAKQLGLHNTKLSNLLSHRVKLNPFLAYKLEAHASMMSRSAKIPAMYWIRSQQKEDLLHIMNDPEMKLNAYKVVKGNIGKKG